jgi:SAM-dependent methyltransferase
VSFFARLRRRADAMPEWYHRDNVFPSRRRMDRAHAPLVRAATRGLVRGGGPVLDLGCGNGALLRKIHAARPDAVPFGVDREAESLAHARLLLPDFAENFVVADLFRLGEPDRIFGGRTPTSRAGRPTFALAVVSIARFRDAQPVEADHLRRWLSRHAERWFVYRYGRTTESELEVLAARAGLRLDPSLGDGVRWVAREG